MKNYLNKLVLILPVLISCESFLEIEPPKNQLVEEHVFVEAGTVEASLAHVYIQLRENVFTKGNLSGLTYMFGHYADEFEHLNENQLEARNYFNNSLSSTDDGISQMWNNAYNAIYACNLILEGVQKSDSLTKEQMDRFTGEAYFIRAFIHFYLLNIFGPIPYLETTDYRINSKISKMDETEVFLKLIEDVQESRKLLFGIDSKPKQIRPDYWTSSAFLARIHLFNKDWQQASLIATQIIEEAPFELETELNHVFLISSKETLWQLDTGNTGKNTNEGGIFIPMTTPPRNTCLSRSIMDSFEVGDNRMTDWVGFISDGSTIWYYPFKYKETGYTASTQECPILFRLAEVYLIAAEANAQLGNIDKSMSFLNVIRNRASLPTVMEVDKNKLLELIYHERRIELFSELGHRFFDLKRTGRADLVLPITKPNWESTDRLLPLPDEEILKNPNLLPQNNGY